MAIISYLNTVRLEYGALAGLPEDLAASGIKRPLIIADKGVTAAGITQRVMDAMPDEMAHIVFDDVPTNPTEEAVEAALEIYHREKCDGLVAVGGGSPMDLAKGVAILATHPAPLQQYAAALGGAPKITAAVAPVIAIPTTAGTGSEVGRGSVITFRDGRKLALIAPYLFPKRGICDPELTLELPPLMTAATGMDAVTHCIEVFISPIDNPVAGAIAIDGLARALEFLPRAVANGNDREARREMMIAAMMGALGFQKGLGAVHALAHPLGGLREFKLHHGTLNAVLLPHVLRFNEGDAATKPKFEPLRRVMGLPKGGDVADYIAKFSASLGMPATLSAMGVPRQVLPAIAKAALLDHAHFTNARKATEQDYAKILDAAF